MGEIKFNLKIIQIICLLYVKSTDKKKLYHTNLFFAKKNCDSCIKTRPSR